MLSLGRETVRRIGLVGVAKLDFKRDPQGGLALLEVNPRFNLWHHPGALAGVNLPGLVYRDLVGLQRPPALGWRAGVQWCNPAHDLPAARAEGVPTWRWLAWACPLRGEVRLRLEDPLPLVRAAVARLPRLARLARLPQIARAGSRR